VRVSIAGPLGGLVISLALVPYAGGQTPAAKSRPTTTATAGQTPAAKTVYVSSQRLFSATPGWEAAEAQFTRIVDSVHAVEKRMDDSLSALLTTYGRDEMTMAADVRVARRKEIEQQHAAFGARRDKMDLELQDRRSELLDPLTARVHTLLADVRRRKGYGMILDLDSGAVLAADSSLDITDQVIAELRTTAAR
jgi:outer membrane protein